QVYVSQAELVRTYADQLFEVLFILAIRLQQELVAKGSLDCRFDIGQIERLGDIVKSAAPHRLDRALDVQVARDQHYHCIPVQPADLLQQLQAAHSGHHYVRQDEVVILFLEILERLGRAGRCFAIVIVSQERMQNGKYVRFVVDDEDSGRACRDLRR